VTFEPTETEAAVAAAARAFARAKVAPVAEENQRRGRIPEALLRQLGAQGLLAINVPAALGGAGAGPVAAALAILELARVDLATSTAVAVTNMVAEIIARWGSPALRGRHLPRLASGEHLAGAFALSEPQAGSDAAGMRARAERRPGGWALTGEKAWITNGDQAGVMVVWARTDPAAGARGITAFLVERGSPGLSVGRSEAKLGQRASGTVSLALDGCPVPDQARLGGEGEGLAVALAALDGGRINIGAQASGTIQAALEASLAWARERRAFGVPIAQHQAVAFGLADVAVDLEASRLLTLRAARLKALSRPFTREASMAKLFASEAAQRAVSRAVQVHGATGCVEGLPARLFRDARVQTIYEGTSEIQRLVIARELLRGA
jgi:alkylation response protein AidB-like acyl-CoA dehydrogenase